MNDSSVKIDVEVGIRIRVLRKRAGLSQADLAAMIGLSRRGLCQYEYGVRRVSLETALLFSKALSVSLDVLICGKRTTTTPDLHRLCDVVRSHISNLPEIGSKSIARRQTAVEALTHLTQTEGAVWKETGDITSLSLGGVRTTCTSGPAGVLINWMNSAQCHLNERG